MDIDQLDILQISKGPREKNLIFKNLKYDPQTLLGVSRGATIWLFMDGRLSRVNYLSLHLLIVFRITQIMS